MRKVITKTISYYIDYIQYNGSNEKELLDFINKHYRNLNKVTEFDHRPKDIPNIGYYDLLKWWKDTDKVTIKVTDPIFKNTETVHSHNPGACPCWDKDELLQITLCHDHDKMMGYLAGIHLNDWLVYDSERDEFNIFYKYIPEYYREVLGIKGESNE